MKVLHVISSGGMYGAEAVILQLARTMARAGDESVLGIFDNLAQPNDEFLRAAARAGVRAEAVVCRGQLDLSVPKRIRALAKKCGADVVHAHGYKADLYAWAGLRGRGVPLVSTCHTWYDNGMALRMYGALDRAALRGFAGVVAVSAEVRARLLAAGVAAERIAVIANGIDTEPFAAATAGEGLGDGVCRVGLVGRLAPEKGVDLFARAAALVRARVPGVRFVVYGEGPERAVLEGLIGELGLGGEFVLAGRREEMAGAFAEMDVMVSASRQEGLPIALLEGMASGRAMVATEVGEVPAVLEDGRTGMLVEAGDVEGLATAIVGLLRDTARRRAIGMAARAVVRERFSADAMLARYREVYGAAIAANAGGLARDRAPAGPRG